MKEKIYIRQWLEMKPYKKQTATDSYYLSLANKVRQVFTGRNYLVVSMYLSNEQVNALACFLVSWFEDVISETGIWKTFTNLHQKQYGKKLPFYDTSEYFDWEINEQDVAFLIWYFLNTMQGDKLISPNNEFISAMASEVMDILDGEYESAPENKVLKGLYSLDEDETDYYIVRFLIDRVLFSSYLFFSDTHKGLNKIEDDVIHENKNHTNLLSFLQEQRDWYLHSARTRMLAVPGKEWVAELLGDSHPLSSDLRKMSQRIRGIFMYTGQDYTDVFLVHVASGKEFILTKKSFDHSHQLTESGTLVYLGIVNWRNEWWFTGTFAALGYDPDLILDEKNSHHSRAQVSFLDHEVHKTEELLRQQEEAFRKYNNNSLIAFMTTDRMTPFADDFLAHYNKLADPTSANVEAATKRAAKEGFFGNAENRFEGLPEAGEPGLVFFNPRAGLEMAFNVTSAFPLSGNPWYDEQESEADILFLLMSKDISTELAYYCLDHCKDKLPWLKGQGKQYLGDIDFLLRFWKAEAYHSEPKVGYVGGSSAAE